MEPDTRTLVTGATGYIGGRLFRLLAGAGCRVRAMARTPRNLAPEKLASEYGSAVEVVAGDVFQSGTLVDALRDMDVAFYLIHSMGASGEFAARDRLAAKNFGEAAKAAGVKKIVYLGGLGDEAADLSNHLQSRQEVGEVLAASGVPVLEFRASIIIGSGSLSFEIVRALTERLPVMVAPKWVHTPAQPIGIEDVLAYLVESVHKPVVGHAIYEIGGSDVASYGAIIREYARQRGLRRFLLPVPFLSPTVSSWWLLLVTPANAVIGRKLIDGVRVPTQVNDAKALVDFAVKPRSLREAMQRALVFEDRDFAETRWTDALSAARETSYGGETFGTRIVDSQLIHVRTGTATAFTPIRQIGGENGWYFGTFLWKIRGLLDELVGGVGLRRGRKSPEYVGVGETIDWWRVEEYEANHLLRLFAEMIVPGRAWLEFEVRPEGDGASIRQTAIFDPKGIVGLAYWYTLYPIHKLMFRGMLRQIAKRAESLARIATPASTR